MGTWIVATGIASLMSSGIIAPTEDQIKGLMEESIRDILNDQLAVQLNY